MVFRCNERHKIFLYHCPPFTAFERAFKIKVDNTLLCNFFLNVVIDKLAVILRAYTGQRLSFCLWNSKFFKSVLYILRNVIPVAAHFCFRADVSCNVFHVKTGNVRHPGSRNTRFIVDFKRFKTEFRHPFRVAFFLTEFFYDFRGKTCLYAVKIFLRLLVAEIVEFAVYVLYLCLFFCHNIILYIRQSHSH